MSWADQVEKDPETMKGGAQSQVEKINKPQDEQTNLTFAWRQMNTKHQGSLLTTVVYTWHLGSLGDPSISEDD